jgi:hypothetical protein
MLSFISYPSLCLDGVDADVFAALFGFKLDLAVNDGVYGVISAQPDMVAGAIFGAFLANDDIARANDLAAKFFDAQSL